MRYLILLTLFPFLVFGEQKPTAAEERYEQEDLLKFQNFSLLAHKQNYLLPVTYNFNPNNGPNEKLRARGIDTGLDRVMRFETKFQLSFKFPLGSSLFFDDDRLWAGYTQLSFWQVYNQNSSRPFRESNYEPELFYFKKTNFSLGKLKLDGMTLGFVHQSNGQTENLSRSWNRAYLLFVFSLEHFVMTFKPWYRFSDGAKDDNPDIEKYLGHFEIRLAYRNAGWTYSLLLRNVLKNDFKGFRELAVSIPFDNNLKWFIQYANGYGESLLDYSSSTNRIGIGLIVSDFL